MGVDIIDSDFPDFEDDLPRLASWLVRESKSMDESRGGVAMGEETEV